MSKLITSFKRNPDMSVEAFREHWSTVQDTTMSRLDGISRYVQNTPWQSAYSRGREPAFDTVGEAWFEADDLEAAAAYRLVHENESGVIDLSTMVSVPVEEIPIIDGPRTSLKLLMFVRRRSDLTVAQFRDHWRDVHAPIAARNPYMRRYVQCHVAEPAAGAAPAAFDGVGMVWFDDMDDVRASGATPDAAEAAEDGKRFADGGAPFATLVVSETTVLG